MEDNADEIEDSSASGSLSSDDFAAFAAAVATRAWNDIRPLVAFTLLRAGTVSPRALKRARISGPNTSSRGRSKSMRSNVGTFSPNASTTRELLRPPEAKTVPGLINVVIGLGGRGG